LSKVIFFCIPAHGHINPTLALAEALVKSGEKVIYYCAQGFAEKISKTGAQVRVITTSFDSVVETQGDKIGKNVIRVARMILEGGLEMLEKTLDEMRREAPDYIITDSATPYGKAAAKILEKPYICIVPIFCMEEGRLPRTPWGTEYRYLLQIMRSPREIIRAYRVIREYQKKHGISGRELLMPFSDFGELNIVTTSRAFQFYQESFSEKRFKFVGPMLFEEREKRDFPVEQLKGKKVVYISMGTIYNKNSGFYRECFKALRGTEYTVVMSKGGERDAPANFIIRDYVPQLQVLPYIGAFITNGGMNSANEAFYFGVPLICVPQAADQYMIGKRARDLGAAIYLKKPGSMKIRAAVDEVFSNPRYKENAVRIGETLINSGGVQRAVEAVFEFKKK
jgi:MGT family glycosyltransferase